MKFGANESDEFMLLLVDGIFLEFGLSCFVDVFVLLLEVAKVLFDEVRGWSVLKDDQGPCSCFLGFLIWLV